MWCVCMYISISIYLYEKSTEWEKMWCIYMYTMEYYEAIEKNKNFAIWMNFEGIILGEMSEKDKYCEITYM